MQSRTIRRRSSVLEARVTNWTVRENSYHRSKTRHVNRKCECEHNIRETGRGGILRQSPEARPFLRCRCVGCGAGGGERGRFAHARPCSHSATITRFKTLKEYYSLLVQLFVIIISSTFFELQILFRLPKFTKMRNQMLNFLLNDGSL